MVAIGALLLTLKLSNKTMETSFIPFSVIIAVLIIAFLFASLPQVNHKTRYRVLYVIAIIMLLAVIPISEYMAGGIQNSSNNYLLLLPRSKVPSQKTYMPTQHHLSSLL